MPLILTVFVISSISQLHGGVESGQPNLEIGEAIAIAEQHIKEAEMHESGLFVASAAYYSDRRIWVIAFTPTLHKIPGQNRSAAWYSSISEVCTRVANSHVG